MMMRYLDEALENCESLIEHSIDDQPLSAVSDSHPSPSSQGELVDQSWSQACQTVGNILTGMGFVEESYPWRSMALDQRPDVSKFYTESARVYSQCEVWDKALYFCQRTLEKEPDNTSIRYRLAKIYNQMGNYRQESQILSELLTLQPDKATAQGHHQLGQILEKQGQLQSAQTSYERAIEQDNRYAPAYYALGEMWSRQRQWDKVIALFNQLIYSLDSKVVSSDAEIDKAETSADLKPEPAIDEKAMAHYRLGRVYRQCNQLEKAVEQFRQSLKIDSHLHWAYMGLLNALMQMQRWDEVIEPCQKLVNRAGEFPWIYTFMGNAFAGKGEWKEAAIAHQEAFKRRGWPQCAERDYIYGRTWFAENIPIWQTHIAGVFSVPSVRSPKQILSLGTQDDAALSWLVDTILSHEQDRLLCLTSQVSPSLDQNASKLDHAEKLVFELVEENPDNVVEALKEKALKSESFSLILVQGDRKEADYRQVLLSEAWPLLEQNGILIIKDYQWHHPSDPSQSSQVGVDAFIADVGDGAEVLLRSHQMIVKKTIPQQVKKDSPREEVSYA